MAYMKTARKGYQWVLTQKGYDATPDSVKSEREVGKPLFKTMGYDQSVPSSWVDKGYVEESHV